MAICAKALTRLPRSRIKQSDSGAVEAEILGDD